MRTEAAPPARRARLRQPARCLIALADRVGDRHGDEHGTRRRDPDDQGERRGGDREDRERRESPRPRARDLAERLAQEEGLGEQEQRRAAERGRETAILMATILSRAYVPAGP